MNKLYIATCSWKYDSWKGIIYPNEDNINDLKSGIENISGENWNKIYIPLDEEFKDIVKMIKDLNNRGVDVYLNVNNHYEGCAPMTIEKIGKLMPSA